ncbi:TlpA family protein disulfide reductase [Deinococcus humi]|uniref:TlpA family protein disulfide reductase n=1 Tax=Deinococcus humi TaxID=662880 RepID=UPI00160FBD0A|nr:TlpA family protein disulfide reductase [Deinococcus humi]
MTDTPRAEPSKPNSAPIWRRVLPPLIAAALVGVLGYTLLSPAKNATTGGPLIGKPAPDFTLTSLDEVSISLASLKGRPVVLNFWASWCGPCREEAPLFRELGAQQTADGAAILGILFQETKEQNARDFIKEFALAYPTLRDPGINTGVDYGVSGIPETVFIDKEGIVQFMDRGGLTRERLNAGLEKIGVKGI